MRQGKKIYCNVCKKEIRMEHDIPMEGVLSIQKEWGYFSQKDGEIHCLDICESCYDRLIENLAIPVTKKKLKEFV